MKVSLVEITRSLKTLGRLVCATSFVIISAYKMRKKSEDKLKWGFLIMIGSIVGLFSVGPFGLGGVLGIMGGISTLNRRQ